MKKSIPAGIVSWAGSLKLALVLVLLLIILGLSAVIFPQQSDFSTADIKAWKVQHTVISKFGEILGLFSVFRSPVFLAVIILFALNILTCTILHLAELKVRPRDRGSVTSWGFLLLHISLLGILAGGFITTSSGMTGTILLTEGQVFTEQKKDYIILSSGPLRKKAHQKFKARLKKTTIVYARGTIPLQVSTVMDFRSQVEQIDNVEIRINHPYTFMGMAFTQDEIGFSPRISVRDPKSGETLLHSFVALKTFREGNNWNYTDFLPVDFLKNRVYLTLFPDHKDEGGKIRKTGELPGKPVLLFEERDPGGRIISKGIIPYGGKSQICGFEFGFHELRYWTSFIVKADPGYAVFGFSVWMGLFSLLLRYSAELKKLFGSEVKK